MKPRQNRPGFLREALRACGGLFERELHGIEASISFTDVMNGSALREPFEALADRSVLVATRSQLLAALALIDLDGVAGRIILCPSDLPPEHLTAIATTASVDAIVTDRDPREFSALSHRVVTCALPLLARPSKTHTQPHQTQWVLLTSGTMGVPKLALHSFAGLTGAISVTTKQHPAPVWATFYDIRRYGGLQIYLRAVLGPGSLVLSDAGEPVVEQLHRLGRHGVTHISGTPSHWRRALMSPAARAIKPDYVRLSGEIVDQTILDHLRRNYPNASIGHAYASTEAGVGFEVTDGLAGFPEALLRGDGEVKLKVEGGSLRIRSPRTANGYVGSFDAQILEADGYVDTGDMVELRGNRYYFVGRRGGIINVGGLKVHPEEVEAAINRHESVRMSRVRARQNPITGAIIVADIVLNDGVRAEEERVGTRLREGILRVCRDQLASHKVPGLIRFVPSLDVTAAGKLSRAYA
jgi:acyl-coenzyme A synthetase/AMP-(fatty) acid ligase